jgi:hypothetical protein
MGLYQYDEEKRRRDEDFCATILNNRHGIGMKTKKKEKIGRNKSVCK